MNTSPADKLFAGPVPVLYESHLVPLIFECYAEDLAQRVASQPVSRVLEIAAGTGVVTRRLASVLPASVTLVATDLNQPMLDMAATIGTSRPVQWQQADALQLPFEDGEFDAVVCQFGIMFIPEPAQAFAEIRRVLKAGGVFIFNVWDRIEENHFAHTITMALESIFPDDPPRFLARTPHGYHDCAVIKRDLQNGGFQNTPDFVTVAANNRASTSLDPVVGYCQGTPLYNEIVSRGNARLADAIDAAEKAIRKQFGSGPVSGKIQAHIVSVEK